LAGNIDRVMILDFDIESTHGIMPVILLSPKFTCNATIEAGKKTSF